MLKNDAQMQRQRLSLDFGPKPLPRVTPQPPQVLAATSTWSPKPSPTAVFEGTLPLTGVAAPQKLGGLDSKKTWRVVGSVGGLVSVAPTVERNFSAAQTLRTFDVRTGRAMRLDRLLPNAQFQAVVNVLESQGCLLSEAARKQANENFAITMSTDRTLRIAVAFQVPQDKKGKQTPFDRPNRLVSFEVPDDPTFRFRARLSR